MYRSPCSPRCISDSACSLILTSSLSRFQIFLSAVSDGLAFLRWFIYHWGCTANWLYKMSSLSYSIVPCMTVSTVLPLPVFGTFRNSDVRRLDSIGYLTPLFSLFNTSIMVTYCGYSPHILCVFFLSSPSLFFSTTSSWADFIRYHKVDPWCSLLMKSSTGQTRSDNLTYF